MSNDSNEEYVNLYEVRKFALAHAGALQQNVGGDDRATMLEDAEVIYQWLITQ